MCIRVDRWIADSRTTVNIDSLLLKTLAKTLDGQITREARALGTGKEQADRASSRNHPR